MKRKPHAVTAERLRKRAEKSRHRLEVVDQVEDILHDTQLTEEELSHVLRVSAFAIHSWRKGWVLPQRTNRDAIYRLYSQRKDDKIFLNDEDIELIDNPRPLRIRKDIIKKSKRFKVIPLNKLELWWVNSRLRNWIMKG